MRLFYRKQYQYSNKLFRYRNYKDPDKIKFTGKGSFLASDSFPSKHLLPGERAEKLYFAGMSGNFGFKIRSPGCHHKFRRKVLKKIKDFETWAILA